MAEEAATADVNAEIDTDIFADEAETTAPTEESKDTTSTEEAKPQAEAEVEEPTKDTETEGTEEKAEGDEPAEATDTEETETEQPKETRAQERIRSLANENRTLRQTVETLNSQVYRAQTPQEIQQAALDQGQDLDPAMAEIHALRQEQQIERYTNQVVNTTQSVESSAVQALNDFPVFNPESDQYDKDLASRAQQVYQQVAGIQTDEHTGLIAAVNVLPYDIFKAFAETHGSSVRTGEVKGQQATEKMIARTDAPSAAAPKPAKVDPIIELWKD